MRILLCIAMSFVTIVSICRAQPGMTAESCQPCSLNVSTLDSSDYTDNINGCSFRIRYERFSNVCNDHWDIKIHSVTLLSPCTAYSVEKIVALGILLLLQNNVPGFPVPSSGGTTKIRVLSPACWQYRSTPPTDVGVQKIVPCANENTCCLYYLLKSIPNCNDVRLQYVPSSNVLTTCNSPHCKYMCEDVWEVFFKK